MMSSYEVFEKLPEEKKEKIIRACMEVFAEKGFEGASTNEIVQKAGISKGILFHYFGNKKDLFLYILDKTLDKAVNELNSYLDPLPSDIFERIAITGMMKLKMALEQPLVYKLIYITFVNTPDSLKAAVQERYKKLYDIALPMIYNGIDYSRVRDGVDPQKAIEVLVLFMEGFQAQYLEAYKNLTAEQSLLLLDKLKSDSIEYMEILKKGIYGC
ncbi:MAG TPA: TetR/AcrR family transcriptional regulator [Clostridia bacterium]|nr:TetR/AcrR family transcriptional regulator [Clostridia bacterium]